MASAKLSDKNPLCLVVDLDHEKADRVPIDDLGGGGRLLAMRLWEVYANQDNPIVVAPGMMAQMHLPFARGYAIATKSPVTGMVECSYAEGGVASALASLGVSAMVLVGGQREYGSLLIEEGNISFHMDTELHGMPLNALMAHYEGWHVMAAGPAAERGCRFSSLLCDGNNVGRGGMGLVFADKNLQVVALRGEVKPEVPVEGADLSLLGEAWRSWNPQSLVQAGRKAGWLALHGFQDCDDGRLWALEHVTERPFDYLALGPNIGLFNPSHISTLIRLCDQMGLDPISMGIYLLVAHKDHLAGKEQFPDLVQNLGSARFREDPAMEKYRIGTLELYPLDLRALPAQTMLARLGEDTILYEELLGGGRDDGDILSLARMAFRGVERSMAFEVMGLSKTFSALCAMGKIPQPFELLSRVTGVDDVAELAHEAMRVEKRLDAKLGGKRGGAIPECFVTETRYGDPRQRVARIGRLGEVYLALKEAIVSL